MVLAGLSEVFINQLSFSPFTVAWETLQCWIWLGLFGLLGAVSPYSRVCPFLPWLLVPMGWFSGWPVGATARACSCRQTMCPRSHSSTSKAHVVGQHTAAWVEKSEAKDTERTSLPTEIQGWCQRPLRDQPCTHLEPQGTGVIDNWGAGRGSGQQLEARPQHQ